MPATFHPGLDEVLPREGHREVKMSEEFIESPQAAGRRPYARTMFVLQALLVALVVGWVLDLQRRVLKLNLYTEQMLLAVLGLAIAICFLITRRQHLLWNLIAGCARPGAVLLPRVALPAAQHRAHLAAARRHPHLGAARGCWCSRARGAWRASRSSASRSPAWCTRCSGTTCRACSRRGRWISRGCWSTSTSTPTRCSARRCRSRSSWSCRSSCSGQRARALRRLGVLHRPRARLDGPLPRRLGQGGGGRLGLLRHDLGQRGGERRPRSAWSPSRS